MKIGGYFEIELNKTKGYHINGLKFNYGRYAFEYILKIRNYETLYIPYYTCGVIQEILQNLNIKYKFYEIDEYLKPTNENIFIDQNVGFLYTNYFGLFDYYINQLKIKNLIIDNSQSFFSKINPNYDSFNSARKFFGVPDGAYAFIKDNNIELYKNLEIDTSYMNFSHLLKRADTGPKSGYLDFQNYENKIKDKGMMKMSCLTNKLLNSIDYDKIQSKRIENFLFLKKKLKKKNMLKIDFDNISNPMCYPLLIENENIKEKLLEKNIFIPTYWKNVYKDTNQNSFEYFLTNNLLALPIDQRYNANDLNYIVELINLYI